MWKMQIENAEKAEKSAKKQKNACDPAGKRARDIRIITERKQTAVDFMRVRVYIIYSMYF